MRTVRNRVVPFIACLGALALIVPVARVLAQAAAADTAGAKLWVGKAKEYEEYLKTAEVVKMEDVGLGVTHPHRAHLAPGGRLLFEHGYDQSGRCCALLAESGYREVTAHRDLAGIERVSEGRI